MYRPEDRSPDVQQKLRVSNAPAIGQARQMSKAHDNNYYESAEQRTANPRGTESQVRGSDVELGGRNGWPMSNNPPLTNPGAQPSKRKDASRGQTERGRTRVRSKKRVRIRDEDGHQRRRVRVDTIGRRSVASRTRVRLSLSRV